MTRCWQIDRSGRLPTKMVDGIVLKVDSPGGGVYETAQIYRKIVEGKEEYDKPFYVSMGSMAASGGYYVSAPADKIFAESNHYRLDRGHHAKHELQRFGRTLRRHFQYDQKRQT